MSSKKLVLVPTWLGFLIIGLVVWGLIELIDSDDARPLQSTPQLSLQSPPVATSTPVEPSSVPVDQQSKEFAWMERGKDSVRSKLKDAASAQFRNVYFYRGKDGIPMTCGEVNSRNSFGGYGGFQRFISAGREDLTFLAEQMDAGEFAKAWNQMCAG